MDWLIRQYVEHLAVLVSATLTPAIFLRPKAIVPPRQVSQLTILKTGMLVPLRDQQVLYTAYVQPERYVTCS